MVMPMVQVRPVFMSVLFRAVFVPVCMAHRILKPFMLVVVMGVVMPVHVLMRYRIVSMDMLMPLAE